MTKRPLPSLVLLYSMQTLLMFVAVMVIASSRVRAAPIIEVGFESGAAGSSGGYVGLDGLGAEVASGRSFHFASWIYASGELVSVTALEGGRFTKYVYEDGTLDVYVEWKNPDGFIEVGGFSAPLTNIVSVVEEGSGGDLPLTQDTFRLGPGLLTAGFADYLGAKQETLGGVMFFYLELIRGDITSPVRRGSFNFNNISVQAEAVPEPALGILALGGVAAVLLRRRR